MPSCSGITEGDGDGSGEPGPGAPGSGPVGSVTTPTQIDSAPCDAVSPLVQRIVRLTFGQVSTTMQVLLGPQALASVTLDSPKQRKFQALSAEGDLISIAGFGVTTADLAGQPILDSPHTVPLEGLRA